MTITLTREEAHGLLAALAELNRLSIGKNAICLPAEIDDAMELLEARFSAPEPEPVAKDGSWVSVHKSCVQDCWCHKCNENTVVKVGGYDIPYKATTMILCPDCGNKRCPKANDHDNACTGSNELGQPGSAYADVAPPQREWKELTTAETKALWNATKKASAFAELISAKLKEKNL